jgi:uncharacterized protein
MMLWRRPPGPAGKASWRSFVVRHLRRLAVAYVVLVIAIAFGQRSVMYLPHTQKIAPEAAGLVGVRESGLVTPDGERLVVWRAAAKPGQPTIVYFHGNGEPLAARARRIASFQAAGYGVHIHAYRGFSGSTGRPSEAAIIADARLAYDTVRAEGVRAADIVLYGESLGTGVATQIAVSRPAAGLILEAPFTSLPAAWKQFVPFLPVDWLLIDRYESDRLIGSLTMPLLIIHGAQDRLVGAGLGRALFALAPEPKTIAILPGAHHNNVYGHGAMEHVRQFIEGLGFTRRD